MSFNKSPLLVLQSLTQPKTSEPKKEKVVLTAGFHPPRKEIASTAPKETIPLKKVAIAENNKVSGLEPYNCFRQQPNNRTKSPYQSRKANNKSPVILQGSPQVNPVSQSGSPIPQENLTKSPISIMNENVPLILGEMDTNEEIKLKLEFAYNDFQLTDFHASSMSLVEIEEAVEKALTSQTKLPFGTIFRLFYNQISTHYKLRMFGPCKHSLNNCFLNYQLYKEHTIPRKNLYYNFENQQELSSLIDHILRKSMFKKFKCKTHLQACLLSSETGNHVEAYVHAKKASKIACEQLKETLITFYYLFLQSKKSFAQSEVKTDAGEVFAETSLEDSGTYIPGKSASKRRKTTSDSFKDISALENDEIQIGDTRNMAFLVDTEPYLKDMIPILECIIGRIEGKNVFVNTEKPNHNKHKAKVLEFLRNKARTYSFPEVNMKNLYGHVSGTHFLYLTNIMGIAQVQPLSSSHFSENWTVLDVIRADNIIEQVLLLIITLYALSTELRFWNDQIQQQMPPKSRLMELVYGYMPPSSLMKESELWIGKSLEFAYLFLPHNCPIADQIFGIYSKLYSSTRFTIPEEEEIEQDIKCLAPVKGIPRSTFFFIPLIKKGAVAGEDNVLTLLNTQREFDQKFSSLLKQIRLYETNPKYFELLTKNYHPFSTPNKDIRLYDADQQKRKQSVVNSAPSTQVSLTRKSPASKSPAQKDGWFINSGNNFFIPEISDKAPRFKEIPAFATQPSLPKRKIELPQNLSNRRISRGSVPEVDSSSPVQKMKDSDPNVKSNRKPDPRQDNSRHPIETLTVGKMFFRPPTSGLDLTISNNLRIPQRNPEARLNNSPLLAAKASREEVVKPYLGDNEEKDPPTLLMKDIIKDHKSDQIDNKKWIRPSPDGRLKVLNRRVHKGSEETLFRKTDSSNQSLFNKSSNNTKFEIPNLDKSLPLFKVKTMRSSSQEGNTGGKKVTIQARSPSRAVTSIKTRPKRDFKPNQTEGDEEKIVEKEVNRLAATDIKFYNHTVDVTALLNRRKSNNRLTKH